MACNVFGTPITDETLKALPEYFDKQISQKDRAYVAMVMKNAEGKDVNARQFVEALGEQFPKGLETTMCLIYNATGDTVTFVRDYQWEGHLTASPYPVVISNGQWGVFVHGQRSNGGNTQAAVVYSGKNNEGAYKNWVISWRHNTNALNRVYTEVHEPNHYQDNVFRDYIAGFVCNSASVCLVNQKGVLLLGSIGNMDRSVLEAIMTLPGTIGLE